MVEAYGQLEEDKPNLVYIDINIASMVPNRSQKFMERLPVSIEQKLARDYSKISAITWTFRNLWFSYRRSYDIQSRS